MISFGRKKKKKLKMVGPITLRPASSDHHLMLIAQILDQYLPPSFGK